MSKGSGGGADLDKVARVMEREYRITLTAERAAQVSAVNQACDEFEVSREDVEVLSAEPIAGRWSVRVRSRTTERISRGVSLTRDLHFRRSAHRSARDRCQGSALPLS